MYNTGGIGEFMDSGKSNWTRRKFMLVGAAGVAAAPLFVKLYEMTAQAKTVQDEKTVKREDSIYDNPKCKGCQMCTILYSNCLALNNRVCWCETREKTA
jgi:hypothetical protein